MARFEDGSYDTAACRALIAKVLAGRCKMEYTRVAVGKGTIPEGMTPGTMDGPADYVMDGILTGVSNPVDGECQISVQINSKDVETGFHATCIVLYANDPDLGEIPYTYLVLENEPEWIRPASAVVGKLATFDIIAAVGAVDTVSAVIDPEAIATMVNVEQLIQAHDNDPNAHSSQWKVIATRIRDPAKPAYGLGGGGDQTEVAVALDTGAYTGGTEVSVIVDGIEYDAKNMSVTGETAPDGTLIIKKVEA